MIKFSPLLATLLFAGSVLYPETSQAATYTNPSVPGADPAVVDGQNGLFYLFVTSGYDTTRYSSTDMVTWTNGTRAYKEVRNRQGWAPTLWKDGPTWHMFTVKAHASSDDIEGEFSLVGNGNGVGFDPMYYGLIDNKHHMFLGGTQTMNQLKLMDDPENETPGGNTVFYYIPSYYTHIFEGTWVHKHNDIYYLMVSIETARGAGYRLAYATADNPRGPWEFQTEDIDDAFLRQSDHEQIWGVGHHCMIADSLGTQWVYYQQKDNAQSNWARSIAVDPIWFDTSGRPHMRPTRGTERPGPESDPAVIWPTVAASSQIEAETYAGSAYTDLQNGGSGEVVEFVDPGGFLAFRNVDFGDGKNGFSVTLSCQEPGTMPASLQIRLGGVDEPVVGTLSVSQTSGYVELTGKLNQEVTGIHDVIVRANGAFLNDTPLFLDHLSFTDQGAGSVNLPPIALEDTAQTAMSDPVTIAVLANDTDPEGQTLTVTAAGRAGNNTNNKSFKGGTLSVDGDTITYTPSGNYWGEDVFFYAVRDSEGLHGRAKVSVSVLPPTQIESIKDGVMVVEAEDNFESFQMNDTVVFSKESTQPGFVGSGYVTTPDTGRGRMGKPCRLTYALEVPESKAGLYRLWMRVLSPSANSNSSGVSLSRRPMEYETEDATLMIPQDRSASGDWVWVKQYNTVSLTEGVYKMSLWRDQDGQLIDRFLLASDPSYDPNLIDGGRGPAVPGANTAPLADAGPDQSVQDVDSSGSERVPLNGSGSSAAGGSIVSYTWIEDEAVIATGASPVVDFSVGTHPVRLDVVDDAGAVASDSVTITVTAVPRENRLGEKVEAESLDGQNGISVMAGSRLTNIDDGDWARYDSFNFGPGAVRFEVTAGASSGGGTVEVRLDSATGTVLGAATVSSTGDLSDFRSNSANLAPPPTGVHDLFLTFSGPGGGSLMDLDSFQFLRKLLGQPTAQRRPGRRGIRRSFFGSFRP